MSRLPPLVVVQIAGRSYGVVLLPHVRRAPWCKMMAAFNTSLGHLSQISEQQSVVLAEMPAIVTGLFDTFGSMPSTALDLLCDYAPSIAADRARIEAEGYDEEIIAAFAVVFDQFRRQGAH